MGQSASTQREREEFSRRDSRRFSQLVRERYTQHDSYGMSDSPESTPEEPPSSSTPRNYNHERAYIAQPFATLRRHISAQSVPLRGGTRSTARGSSTRDEVLYEQEERLLVGVDDMRMSQAPITSITASPMPNRPSVMSRLGSRLLPRSATMSSIATEENARNHPRILRRDNPSQRRPQTSDNRRSRRFSMLSSFPGTSTSTLSSNRPRQLAPISRPFPLMVDGGSLPSSGLPTIPLHATTSDQSNVNYNGIIEDASASIRRSRLERVRRSISSPIENLFSSSSNQPSQDRQVQTPPRRPSRVPIADETDYLLPPLNVTDTNIDLDETGSRGFDYSDPRSIEVFAPVPESPPPWTHRWDERGVRRDARRVPNLLRGRSSRIIRRDDEAPLSRILQFTAAAIAAQLSGTPDAIGDMEPIGDDGLDGSLNTFVETLNNAATTAATGTEANRTFATLPPMNFLRVFRFVNTNADRRRAQASSAQSESAGTSQTGNGGDEDEGSDGRTVTLVVVGVRSVPSASINHDGSEGSQASLDALLSLPLLPPQAPLRNGPGGLLRHSDGRSRFSARRRASMGGVNPFPANYDSQRHSRIYGTSRPGSGHTTPVNTASVPLVLSESPPGPHPPPSTPADPGLSAQASGNTTPNRRPSSASAVHHTPTLHRDNSVQRSQEANTTAPAELDATQTVRQRRRSDSEFARHRDLGAGAARRNGVVEPDNAPSQSRSWLIYVVGTNLSEDHPAFATPSLFTDVSTLHFLNCNLDVGTPINDQFRIPPTRICFCYHHC